ncbi:hypothetical protein U1Q18_032744 [Sarracenia purpurea var. burkii]
MVGMSIGAHTTKRESFHNLGVQEKKKMRKSILEVDEPYCVVSDSNNFTNNFQRRRFHTQDERNHTLLDLDFQVDIVTGPMVGIVGRSHLPGFIDFLAGLAAGSMVGIVGQLAWSHCSTELTALVAGSGEAASGSDVA